jgi:membrane protease YdiL (CAAX protease family)
LILDCKENCFGARFGITHFLGNFISCRIFLLQHFELCTSLLEFFGLTKNYFKFCGGNLIHKMQVGIVFDCLPLAIGWNVHFFRKYKDADLASIVAASRFWRWILISLTEMF